MKRAKVERGESYGVLECPFCGEYPNVEKWHGGSPSKTMVSCCEDRCYVQPNVSGDTAEIAVTRWNARCTHSEQFVK